MSLSDLPDDILGSISFWLNGFDNCSLWMASERKLKQRLVNNIITDFWIKYTIPGRYIWPGNFLKKLQRLSHLSLVVDLQMFYIPIENVELFPIETLKYFKLVCNNSHRILENPDFDSKATGPATPPSDHQKYININEIYPNLKYLEFKSRSSSQKTYFTIDVLRCLPQNLTTLVIPQTTLKIEAQNPEKDINVYIALLPRTLTMLDLTIMDGVKGALDASNLPPNLTSLAATNIFIDPQSKSMIPQSMKRLDLAHRSFSIETLSPLLPAGLESLSIRLHTNLVIVKPLYHLKHLTNLKIICTIRSPNIDVSYLLPNLTSLTTNALVENPESLPTSITMIDLSLGFNDSEELAPCFSTGLRNLSIRVDSDDYVLDSLLHLKQLEELQIFSLSSEPRFMRTQASTDEDLDDDIDDLNSETSSLETIKNEVKLPQTLKKLSIFCREETEHFPLFSMLPKNLTSLDSNLDFQENLSLLPESLTHLHLTAVANPCETSHFDQLPPKLETLILHNLDVPKPILMSLPETLTKLNIDMGFVDDEVIAILPRSLISLQLRPMVSITDASAGQYPPNLTFLCINAHDNLTDHAIAQLPRTLTSLELRSSTELTDECIKYLPRRLYEVSLPQCTKITWRCCEDLPPYLFSLRLPSSSDWVDEALEKLPKYLQELLIPPSETLRTKFYEAIETRMN